MIKIKNIPETDQEPEQYPIKPRYHPIHKIPRKIFDLLASSKLAMVLLILILGCCVTGVTVLRQQRAYTLIFDTLWFNGLLVLLMVNVACCFFGRIWGRKITIISFGMILFHLSFVAMFAGIIYNSLFYFRGSMRLTEGETLLNRERQSYDNVEKGRFFKLSRLKGETTLNSLHIAYKVDGVDKRRAYDVSVGNGSAQKHEIIYLTKSLEYNGFKYFPDQEGYSILTTLYDKQGKEIYGAFVPLQSLKQMDKTIFYTTGTKNGPGSVQFPQKPEKALFDLQVAYRPDPKKERAGDAFFLANPIGVEYKIEGKKSLEKSKSAIGVKFDAGDYAFSVKEVRYWASMMVRYEPGQPIVLTSLWAGLAGMIITFFGRIRKNRA